MHPCPLSNCVCVCVCLCVCVCVYGPQTELSDGVAMMVGNNDRIQGIISQLEETCRTIEVRIPVVERTWPLTHTASSHMHTHN